MRTAKRYCVQSPGNRALFLLVRKGRTLYLLITPQNENKKYLSRSEIYILPLLTSMGAINLAS